MNFQKKYIFPIILFLTFLCSSIAYAQFGASISGGMESQEQHNMKIKERARIKKHNELILAEEERLNNGKQTGMIITIVGGVIMCFGGFVWISNNNK